MKIALLLLLLFATPAWAESKPKSPFPEAKTNEPVAVEADTLEVQQDKNQAIFSGNVIAKQGDILIKADRMIVFYRTADDTKDGQQRVSKIETEGNVLLTTPNETARGKNGVYLADERMLKLTGDVVLTQDKNVLRGEVLEYDMANGRSRLLGAVGAATATQPASSGRVRGLFVPEKQKP
jgi:lipopolysaccharide export system protein LptA